VVTTLILTVTRECNLRCSYCPTAKDGWPSLSRDDALRAVDLFVTRFGGGDLKLFGGEPLLVPDVVRAVLEEAERRSQIRRAYLSTNGLGLDGEWLRVLRGQKKTILTISLDGRPDDHRRHRRVLPTLAVPDAYDHVVGLLPELVRAPRVVVTQTIAPATAEGAAENFEHLLGLGFTRFNLLPGYYLPWSRVQLAALRRAFAAIEATIVARWERGERLYLRNLFTFAPTPFFNDGLVVDADGTIHPSNLGLSAALDDLRGHTQVGSLDAPPTPEELGAKAARVNELLAERLPPRIWRSTQAADRELGRLCHRLYPAYLAQRSRRGAAGAATPEPMRVA
jgi:MoaA/NifB/PqqE/SkfB family radical SAM enzyme